MKRVERRQTEAIRRLEVTHDDDPLFERHVLAAKTRPNERGFTLSKSRSANKIDAGVFNSSTLPIAKRMRWGARRIEFVRPSQWLVMLFGKDVVPAEILGQKAGNQSRGHRFHHPAAVTIAEPKHYLDALQKAHVLADFDARRAQIRAKVEKLAA